MTRASVHTPTLTNDDALRAGANAADALGRALARLCGAAPACAGALLRSDGAGSFTVVAIAGAPGSEAWVSDPAVLGAAREAYATRREVYERSEQRPDLRIAAMPILDATTHGAATHVRAVAAFLLDDAGADEWAPALARLRLCADLIHAAEAHAAIGVARAAADRAHAALSILCAVNEHDRFFAAAVRFCNEVAARFACSRVAFAESRENGARLLAISHTERFARSTALARAIESAMDECADQSEPVRFPPAPDDQTICRDVGALASAHGARAALCVPVFGRGGVVAAVALEREHDTPFTDDDAETISAIAALCGTRLVELRAHDRWFGVRLVRDVRAALAWAVGPRQTWAKVGAAALLAFLAFAVFTTTPDRVGASMTIQAVARHDVAAPFTGRIARVFVEVGDDVAAGSTVLCELDTTDLRLELAEARADLAAHDTEAAAHMRDGRAAEGQIAQAAAQRVAARIALLEERLSRASVVAAIDGVVVTNALERRTLAPVNEGDTLFEVATTGALLAELFVADAHASRVQEGMTGTLAVAARPGERIPFVIERVDPAARVVDGRNVHRATACLDRAPKWLRPGLTGEARVDAGRARRVERWTRSFVDWVRLRLWL